MTEPTTTLSDLELEAAAYVLGHSRGNERAATKKRLSSDAELRYWVMWWEQRFFSLALHLKPETPRKAVWEQLNQRLFGSPNDPASTTAAHKPSRYWGMSWLTTALASFALVALTVLSTLFVSQQWAPAKDMPTHYASFESGGMVSHIVEKYANGDIACVAVHPTMTADQRVLELWAITNSGPVSLGVLPNKGKSVMKAPAVMKQVKGVMTLAVSVEPAGGSPSGLPTGPVVNTAKLTQTNASQRISF
jgi:anti-sigma-K factor RskA